MNIFLLIQKTSSSFFMLWSQGINSKEPILLANVAWARICKCLRSPGIDFKEPIPLANVAWARICKRLRSPGIDSKEPIPLANVAWARIRNCLRSPEIDSLGIDSEESIPPASRYNKYKYGLRLHWLAELVPWNRFLGFITWRTKTKTIFFGWKLIY
jgi:hypothetical protein